MKQIQLFILISIFSISCTNQVVFEENHRFKDNNWFRFDDLIYEINVEAGKVYSFSGNIITDATYKSRKMDLGFYLYLPSGVHRLDDKSIRILDYEFHHLGEKTKDTYILPVIFKDELKISESGLLKIKISNHSQYVDNLGIIGLDLIIKEK